MTTWRASPFVEATVALAWVLAAIGVFMLFWYLYSRDVSPFGLYACDEELSTCERLIWTNTFDDCEAARVEYERSPTVGDTLICIRRSSFVTD